MGRQWLHAKRAIVNLKKGQVVQKLVKEITVARGHDEAVARLAVDEQDLVSEQELPVARPARCGQKVGDWNRHPCGLALDKARGVDLSLQRHMRDTRGRGGEPAVGQRAKTFSIAARSARAP